MWLPRLEIIRLREWSEGGDLGFEAEIWADVWVDGIDCAFVYLYIYSFIFWRALIKTREAFYLLPSQILYVSFSQISQLCKLVILDPHPHPNFIYYAFFLSLSNFRYLSNQEDPIHLQPSPSTQPHNGAVTSTALSTTALTLSPNTRFAHSTSKSSNHTFATILSTLISIPGTGIPSLWRRASSFSWAYVSEDSEVSGSEGEEGLISEDIEGEEEGDGIPVDRRGVVMGTRLSAPNWASRNMKRRSRRSVGVRCACRLRAGGEWECEWGDLLADSRKC